MRVHLRYFASIREALGRREEALDVPEGASVEQVWQRLVAENPRLRDQRYRPAVNQEYVEPRAVLHDGDEVVFIPPVSGGRRGHIAARLPNRLGETTDACR